MADKTQQGESLPIEKFIQRVATIFGFIAGAVGLVYAIGFAIVNISLLSYGVYEVALVRTRYVSAGVAFLVFVTILAVLAIATRIFTTKVLGRFGKSPTVALMTGLVILFILSFLLAWLSLGWRSEVFREAWKAFRPAFEATREFGLLEGYEELEKNVTVRLTIWCFLVSALFLFVISDKPRFLKKFVGYFSPVVSIRSDADQSDNTTETSSDDSRPEAQRDGVGSDNDSESNPIRRAVERHLRWPIVVMLLVVFLYFYGLKRFLEKLVGFFSPVVSTKSDADQSDNATETSSDDSRPEAQRDGVGSDNDSESNPIRRAVERHLRWPIVAMLLVMLLYFYGLKAYATFPAALGGDLPIVVQFSATEADLAELSQLGIDVDPVTPGRTQRVALIAQTDKNFIVLVLDPILKQDVAVSLPKSHVDGIVYYPEEYYLNDEYVAEKSAQDGWVLLEQDNPDIDAAIDAFEKAKRRIPNYVPALLGLGDAYQLKGQQGAAKHWYAEAEKSICNYLDIETVSALGNAYVSLEEYDLAIAVYQRALPPENQENVTGNIGCPDNKLLSDVQSKALIHYKLAQAYLRSTYPRSQKYSKVADEVRKAIELIELDETAQEKIDYRQKAKTDPVFDQDNLRLDTKFLETIFASVNDAVIWYGAEGDRLRDENELKAAVMRYTWAISLTLQLEDYDSLEEARLRFRRAGVDLMLWDGANTEDKASYQKEAIAQYKKSVDLAPDNPAYRTGLADAYRQIDDLDKAIATYLEVISPTTNLDYATPEYVPAWIGLGEAYLRREQDEDAQQANKRFAQALKLQPENGQAYYGCARAEASLGNIPEARKCLRRAINLDANLIGRAKKEPVFDQISDLSEIVSATQSFQDGNRLASEGNLEEALEKYKDAIAKDDKNAVYYASLGDIYFMLQRLSEAETEFKNAIDLAPENDSYHYRLAGVYYDQGKFDSAVEEYERALAINDENPMYHSGLGDAFRQMGMLAKAAGAYEQAIMLDQSNARYHARLADIYYRRGNQEDALRKYLEAIRLDEENYMYPYGLARVYYARDELQKAIQSYEAAIEHNPEYGEAYCGLGQAYQRSKQRQDAIEAFEQCRAVSQDEGLRKQAEEALAQLGGQ